MTIRQVAKVNDVWDSLIKIEFCELQSAYEEKVKDIMKLKNIRKSRARSDVYEEMRPLYRRAIIKRFLSRLLWFDSIRHDAVYKAIRASAERLRNEEDYGRQEALQYATNKRKYLFDKLLSDYGPPEISADGDDNVMMMMMITKVIRSCATYKHHGFYICYYRFELHERESD